VEYGRLGERQHRMRVPVLEILSSMLLFGAIILGMLELVEYSSTKDDLPTDLTIAGIPVGGLSEADVQIRLEEIYVDQPVQLFYLGSPIVLDPVEVGFRLNAEAMLAEARAQSTQSQDFWAGFWNFLGRRPVAAVTVPLNAEVVESNVRDYLLALKERYDIQPGDAGFDLGTLTFRSGQMGQGLDVDAAVPLVMEALVQPEAPNRRVDLPTLQVGGAEGGMETLRQAILDLMANRGFVYNGDETLASVYVMDLATGEEIGILEDVRHSGVSTIKIPIMINLFKQKLLMDQESAYLLTESILCSNNASSNLLMQVSGATGDITTAEAQLRNGLNQVSCSAQELGAEQTYISAPLWVADRAYEFEAAVCRPQTQGNPDFNAATDPYAQTTAEDMGMLLTQIYDCANNGSGLMALYPDDITQTECRQMLEVLSGNRIGRLIELGVPEGTRVAHKNGWGPPGTSADAAIVFSPGGDYVLVMYTWELDKDGNNLPTLQAWELIEDVSRLTYNYFNPSQPLLEPRQPLNPLGAIDCVTVMSPDQVNLDDIDANRVDENGEPLPGACYGGASHYNPATGSCLEWDNWGRN